MDLTALWLLRAATRAEGRIRKVVGLGIAWDGPSPRLSQSTVPIRTQNQHQPSLTAGQGYRSCSIIVSLANQDFLTLERYACMADSGQ